MSLPHRAAAQRDVGSRSPRELAHRAAADRCLRSPVVKIEFLHVAPVHDQARRIDESEEPDPPPLTVKWDESKVVEL